MTSILLLFSVSALAQSTVAVPELNAETFRPALDSTGTLWTEDASRAPNKSSTARLLLGYSWLPFTYISGDDDPVAVVSSVTAANLLLSHNRGRFRLGLDVPLYLRSDSLLGGETGLGDLGVDGKINLLNPGSAPLGLAIHGQLGLPTTSIDAPLGEPGLAGELALVVDKHLGDHLMLAGNLGMRFRPEATYKDSTLDDQFNFRAAAGYAISDATGFGLDVVGGVAATTGDGFEGTPVEGLLSGYRRLGGGNMVLRGGLGTGLSAGIGAPKVRAIVGVGYEPSRAGDADKDGILDTADACPKVPEDLDGYEDRDGCAEPTAVTLKLVDQDGQAVTSPTVKVGEQTGTSLTLEAAEYAVSVTADGYEPLSASLVVPPGPPIERTLTVAYIPATVNIAVVDEKGEPIIHSVWFLNDQKKGAITKGQAEVKIRPGPAKIGAEADGYLRSTESVTLKGGDTVTVTLKLEPTTVKMTKERVDLGGAVYFDLNEATILSSSFKLLDDAASVLKSHPELTKLQIEGHTDSRGDDAYNLDLSKRRAAAVVDYLVSKGVEAGRLSSEGYGETKPLDKAENEAAWAKNRRVDFMIIARSDDAETPAPAPTPAPTPTPNK